MRSKANILVAALSIACGSLFVPQASAYESSLVGYWKMDEAAGTTAGDSTANSYDGTMYNGVTAGAAGVHGSAFAFDGVDDYVECGLPSGLQIAGAFTMSLWIRPEMFMVDAGLMGTGIENYQMTHCWGDSAWGYVDSGTNNVTTYYYQVVPLDQWSHITMTWDGTTDANGMKLYLNGALADQKASAYASISGWDNFRFGLATEFYGGRMDDAAVWDRALDGYEAGAIYELGVEKFEALSAAVEEDSFDLDYSTEELQQLAEVYAAQGTGTIDGVTWSYIGDATLPGEPAGAAVGDSWTYGDNYYIKLGSGLEGTPVGGEVPEPSTLLLVLLLLLLPVCCRYVLHNDRGKERKP